MHNPKVALAILILLGVVTFVQLVYYFLIYGKFAFHRKKKLVLMRDLPISVIVVVRDDAALLLNTLPKLLEQQYPKYEIVVVNDRSRDENSIQAIKEYNDRFPNIKYVDLSEAVSTSRGKKMAMSMGIKCATYEHVLITSPDCVPSSAQWLSEMAPNFQNHKKLVIGYSTYTKSRSPYNLFLHYDKVVGAMQYFSHSLLNTTYRGDFNNIAFVRSLFYQQKGFLSYNHLLFGEDDIFVHRASKPDNTAIEFSPETIVVDQHVPSYGYWRMQKVSLFYTRRLNSLKNRFLLSMFNITNLLFYVSAILSILANVHNFTFLYVSIGIIVARIASLYVTTGISAKKLNEKQVIPFILFYDIIFALLNPLYFAVAQISHKNIS